jgi:UDP-glucose 4-epimerase
VRAATSQPSVPPPVHDLSVLVTGGAGFIGSHVVDRLLAAGHRPRIFDLKSSPYHAPDVVRSVRGDMRDLGALCTAMRGCDAVLHLAAAADVGEVQAYPVDAEERNARGTLHVLEAARRCLVARVIYASTIWVYSDTPAEWLDESAALHAPRHLYSATKLAGELYCRSYQELYDVESTILRFGIPYGPRARAAAVIPTFVTRALAGEPLTIAGDGLQSRRFVYVEDLAQGVVDALAPVAANKTYNLVSSEDVTVTDIAETVRAVVGDVAIVHVAGRTGDFAGAPISGRLAGQELGWRTTTPFADGVRKYVAWHRETMGQASQPAAPARALRSLLERGAIAAGWAAAAAIMILGLASLFPVDEDLDRYDTFLASLVLLLPLIFTAGFSWDAVDTRRLRAMLWTLAVACLAIEVLPGPGLLEELRHSHALLFGLCAISAGLAATLVGASKRLPWRLAPADD